jgi:hypothetical protein
VSKTTKVMVYSATSEAEVARRYAAGVAEAESNGYVPIAEAWDHNTLTVTYQYRGSDPFDNQPIHADVTQRSGGIWSRLTRRAGSR